MENAITAALSNQIVLARALDITANNIANQTTVGFKSEKARFSEYLATIPGNAGPGNAGDDTVSLVYDLDSYTDFSTGGLQQTHADLDFAIDGQGFFAVDTPQGIRYTRDGHFELNAFGDLVDRNGSPVLDDAGAPIFVDPELGPVILSPEGELQQTGTPIARLGVFTFFDQSVLQRAGFGQFATDEIAQPALNPRIRQGFVETSNVAPVASMTEMIEIMRAYESAAQILETASELSRNAVQTLTQAA
ncbi:MAG: flagellar basal-body rod protein FlgF [Pseudomonadota bacterium]